ncbi:MAG: DUF4276 family protein [Acidobacteriia bacterium]|nr:DUF4276 family protein [Terriglobia bacterium]
MSVVPVNLATEDELSEVVLLRILTRLRRYAVGTAYRRGGYGYLRRTIHGWNRAARGIPFIVLTDLDNSECPSRLIEDWLDVPKHPNLLFRVAIREVEAWLLADRVNFSRFLAIAQELVPIDSDGLDDPKATLVNLARQSRLKAIRDRIVPKRDSTAKQGPDYNACLGSFVRDNWDIDAARAASLSLAKTVNRLRVFKPVWT